MKNRLTLSVCLLVAILSLLAVACGGGNGGGKLSDVTLLFAGPVDLSRGEVAQNIQVLNSWDVRAESRLVLKKRSYSYSDDIEDVIELDVRLFSTEGNKYDNYIHFKFSITAPDLEGGNWKANIERFSANLVGDRGFPLAVYFFEQPKERQRAEVLNLAQEVLDFALIGD